MLLQEKISLVTGAGSGIGRAVAIALAREGATVLLLGSTREKLEKTYDQISKNSHQTDQVTIIPLDLEHALHQIPLLVEKIRERYGRLDILINNAAQLGVLTPMAFYEPEMWESVFRVNVTAPYFLTRELLPLLKKSRSASVINVTSGVGHHGRAYWGAYAASKAALINLTETWAHELQKTTVRINMLDPGAVATAMRAQAFPGEDSSRLSAPEVITPAFLYLASDFSSTLRGQEIQAHAWTSWKPPNRTYGEPPHPRP